MKKVIVLLLTACMVMAMATVAVAADEATEDEDILYEPSDYTYEATELSEGKTYGVSVMTMANAFFKKKPIR